MLILGFDQSISRTGWAVYNSRDQRMSRIIFGSFASRPRAHMSTNEKMEIFLTEVIALIKIHQPGFMVWEASEEHIRVMQAQKADLITGKGGKSVTNSHQLILAQLDGALKALAMGKGIPWQTIPARTWRSRMLGNGNMKTDAAKARSVEICKSLGLDVRNDDQAEAVMIAMCAPSCERFKMIQHGVAA